MPATHKLHNGIPMFLWNIYIAKYNIVELNALETQIIFPAKLYKLTRFL